MSVVKEPKTKILFFPVALPPEVREVENTYEKHREMVGGLLECVTLDDGVDIWCNEEGQLLNLPLNRVVPARAREIPEGVDFVIEMSPNLARPGEMGVHLIHGDFFMARTDRDGDVASLTESDIKKYMKAAREPKRIA